MYHNKKLALFISHIYGVFQTEVTHGVIDRAGEYGYRVDVYTTNDGEQLGTWLDGEVSFLDIPDYDGYAGIVFVSGTYASSEMRARVQERLQTLQGTPIVQIDDGDCVFPKVHAENNRTTGILTEHLAQKHGCRRICYLGCSREPFYSEQREQVYRAAMEACHLTPGAQDILSIDESDASYAQALAFFLGTGDRAQNEPGASDAAGSPSIPDAVVCYNDRVAIRFWEEAVRAGIRVPEQMKVTGCDDTQEGRSTRPPLTTVSAPFYGLGRASVDLLHRLMGPVPQAGPDASVAVTAEPVFRGTCGCACPPPEHPLLYAGALRRRTGALEQSILQSFHLSSSLSAARSLDEGLQLLEDFLPTLEDCTGFYVCLYPSWDSLSGRVRELTGLREERGEPEDERILKFGWQSGRRLSECSFRAPALLPAHITFPAEETHFILPLFFRDAVFGYMVLAFRDHTKRYPFQLVQWMMNLSQLLENQRERHNRHVLTEHLEDLYLKDMLTDVHNRHGFDHFAPLLLETVEEGAQVSLLLFDVENLRGIRSRHGHREGDFAVRIAGEAVKNSAPADAVCARFGSGEFYVLMQGDAAQADRVCAQVQNYLAQYTALSPRPYDIHLQTGAASCKRSVALRESGMETLFSAVQRQLSSI